MSKGKKVPFAAVVGFCHTANSLLQERALFEESEDKIADAKGTTVQQGNLVKTVMSYVNHVGSRD